MSRVLWSLRRAGALLYPGEFGAVADWRAIAAGGATQTALTALVFVLQVNYWTAGLAAVAGAAVAGATSRTFEAEYLDGAAATAFGALLTLAVFLGWVWFLARDLPLAWQANFVWLGSVFGGVVVFVAVPFLAIAGAIVGHLAASARRALAAR